MMNKHCNNGVKSSLNRVFTSFWCRNSHKFAMAFSQQNIQHYGLRRQNRWHRCTNFDCEVRFGLCGLRLCRLMCGKALPYRLGTRHESGLRPFWGSNCRAQRDLRSLRAVRHEMFIETRAFQLEFKLRRSETSVSLLKELSILGVPVL